MKAENYVTLEFLSRSANEGFARMAAASFAAQLDPTLDEIGDIKTAPKCTRTYTEQGGCPVPYPQIPKDFLTGL